MFWSNLAACAIWEIAMMFINMLCIFACFDQMLPLLHILIKSCCLRAFSVVLTPSHIRWWVEQLPGPMQILLFWTTSKCYLKKCTRALILNRLAPMALFTQFSVHSCILKVWIQELVPTSCIILRIFENFIFFVEKLLRFRALGQSGFESLWQPPANHHVLLHVSIKSCWLHVDLSTLKGGSWPIILQSHFRSRPQTYSFRFHEEKTRI